MWHVRAETGADIHAIRDVTSAAFADVPYSSQTEAAIIDALRAAGAIRLSLVATDHGRVIGNVIFSNVIISGVGDWVGLGPVAVEPGLQRSGVGSALIAEGLQRLQSEGAAGCVLIGDPGYYGRFGFAAVPGLHYEGVPEAYTLALSFSGEDPAGKVLFHAAFGAR